MAEGSATFLYSLFQEHKPNPAFICLGCWLPSLQGFKSTILLLLLLCSLSLSETKMLSKSSDLPQESPEIRQEDKFYTRLLSKENSLANPSFRVYYGVATGSVPFLWESRPGTPKNTITTTNLPPLTPPPSYYSSPKIESSKKSSKSTLIHTILPRLITLTKAHAPPSPSVSLSSSSTVSSSSSSSFSPTGFTGTHHRRRRSSSTRFSFSSRGDDDDDDDDDGSTPTSALCFRMRHVAAGRLRGCHSVVTMKKALLSIVGHGSSQGTAA